MVLVLFIFWLRLASRFEFLYSKMLRLVIVLIVVAVAAAENFDGFTIGQLEAKLADYHTRLNDIMPDGVLSLRHLDIRPS